MSNYLETYEQGLNEMAVKTVKANNGEEPAEILPNGQVVWARNEKGQPVCNSPRKEKLGPARCKQWQGLSLNGRCELHGGNAPSGVAHYKFKDGRQSKYLDVLNPEMRRQVERLMEDPDYTSLQEDVAIAGMRVRELLAAYGSVDTKALRDLFGAAYEAQELLNGEYDEEDTEELLRRMVELTLKAEEKYNVGKEVEAAQEHRRKLIETENRRRKDQQDQIPAARALLLFTTLRESVRINVWSLVRFLRTHYPQVLRDPLCPDVLTAISQDVDRLLPAQVRQVEPALPSDGS